MKRTIALVLAILMILTVPLATLGATLGNIKALHPSKTGKIDSGANMGLGTRVILAENGISGGSAQIDICSDDLEECRVALELALTDPPDMPLSGFLSSFEWFRDLAPWARVGISTFLTAIILGATVYAGAETQ